MIEYKSLLTIEEAKNLLRLLGVLFIVGAIVAHRAGFKDGVSEMEPVSKEVPDASPLFSDPSWDVFL